mgnify:CR=1 FL=1
MSKYRNIKSVDEFGNKFDAILHVNYQNSRGTTLVIKKSEDYE